MTKKKKDDAAPPESKPSIVEFYRTLAGVLMREENNGLREQIADLPCSFFVTHPSRGTFQILRSDGDDIVQTVPASDVVQEVTKYIDTYLFTRKGYLWGPIQLKHFVDYWTMLARPVAQPATWRWKGDPGLTYHRLPWERGVTGETPTWDTMFERMDANGPALKQWIGSLFDPASDRQQYVWMYGQGNDGKGSLLRFLERVFGNAFKSCEVPEKGDKFWSYGNVLGKRLVAFPDTNSLGFPASGFFKMLSGGDAIPMEIKGGAAFSTRIDTKFIYGSNGRPSLSSEKADLRRIIFVEFTPMQGEPVDGAAFEERLWEEGGAFLTRCIADYQAACPTRGRIRPNTEAIENWVGGGEDFFMSRFDDYFTHSPGAMGCDPLEFTSLVHYLFPRRDVQREFRAWLERVFHIRRTTLRHPDGTRENVMTNVEIPMSSLVLTSKKMRVVPVE
jgi:hypothetical protein